MDLNQIRSFLAVTQTLNFTNAAQQNGVPQSTISRQINDLEKQLNVRLFYRTKRNVQLTDEGRTFLPYAKEMMEAAKKGAYAVKQLHEGAKGRLSIATVFSSGEFLAKCLRDFGKAYPEILVDITYVTGESDFLDEGQDPYDFHFIPWDMLPEAEVFDSLMTHSDQLCLVVPKGHPLTTGTVDTAALQKEKFILVSEEGSPILHMQTMNYFRAHRFTPNIVNRSDNVHSILLSVSSGLGITILPASQPREIMPDALDTIPIDEMDTTISYGVVWKKSLLNPAASLFLKILQQHAKAQQK